MDILGAVELVGHAVDSAGVGAIVGALGATRCGYALAVRWRSMPRKGGG
jgi:hypothetical protein